MHITIIVKKNILLKKVKKGKRNTKQNKKTTQIGTNVRVSGFNAGLLARSQFASALHAALLPMIALTISPYTNVTLTFDFGLDHPVHNY
jgi:hypothetical protein